MDIGTKEEILLPPKPTEPLDSECCGTGCTPCVFDIYKNQVKRWEKECQEILVTGRSNRTNKEDDSSQFITPQKYLQYKPTEIIQETDSIKIYRFAIESHPFPLISEDDFPIKLGQHVLIRLNNISKQFTVLRVNLQERTFDILIKIYPKGEITLLIDKIGVNDLVEMRGPFGKVFEYRPNSFKEIVMLAAGTGIAPMYRIIDKVLNDDDEETRVKLLFACKRLSDIPLIKEFKGWSSHWNFQVVHYLSYKPEPEKLQTGLPYYGMKINVTRLTCDELREQTKGCDMSKTLFIICGTKSFEKDMINNLHKLGDVSNNTVVF